MNQYALDPWYNQTTVHPIGLVALVALGLAIFLAPRRYALVPLLVLACFVSPAQRIVIATLDFNFLRMMVLFGWTRVLLRGELGEFRVKPIDGVVVAWALSAAIITTILHTTMAAFVNRLGYLYDAIGLYFLCRFVVRDWRDVRVFAQSAALISMPVALAFLVEKSTGRNMFAVFGGVPEITVARAGSLRCRGPFSHPILAGCFWAALMPLIGALWWRRGWNRILSVAGLSSALFVVFACSSATPISGLIFGALAAALFPLRHLMAWIRWGTVIGLLGLHFLMVNPIWHLFARINIVSGATGWYRFKLVDEFIRHLGDWWLVGTEGYGDWWGGGFYAITNEYVLQGIEGGLLTLLLFVAIIVMSFRNVGVILREAGRRRYRIVRAAHVPMPFADLSLNASARRKRRLAMAWALGVTLFINCIVFTGVSYFGQTILVWYLSIGMIGSLLPPRAVAPRRVPERPAESSLALALHGRPATLPPVPVGA